MAYSASIKKSQDVLTCGLCETDTKIKVKCMDCDLYMCQKCTEKVHAKFKNADLHDIVALKDIHSHKEDTDVSLEFKPVKCTDHRKHLCCMYCITCEILVCPKCIAKTHHPHLMMEIQTVCKMKVEEMKTIQEQVHNKVEKLMEKLNLMAETEKWKSNYIERKILEEEKQAREVQSQCLMLLEEHKEKTKNNSEKVSKKESKVLEKEKEIEMFMQHVENIHNSKNTEIFFEAVSSLRTKLESFEQSTIPKSFNIITQHYIPNYQIQTNSKTVEIEIQFEIKAKYELDIPHISSITSDKDGNVWITDGRKQTQQLQIKEEIQIIKTLETDLGDAEIRCLNKDVYLASSSFRQICYLAADDKLKVLKDLSPCEPFTIHVSDNEIIVGMDCSSVNDKTDIPIIMRLGFNGKIRQLYKNHGRQLLTRDVVLCCTTITDGTICYIDSHYNTGNLGDVVCIDKDGTIQWKYNGNSLINSKTHSFTPIEVLNTESNNLLVSDKKHHALHVLTAQGGIRTIFDLTIIGIEDPGVMTIDINGILWIHSKEMNRATLSHVKFSGI